MDQEQKDRIIEAVQQAMDGFVTRNELIVKLEQITGAEFAEEIGAEEGTEG